VAAECIRASAPPPFPWHALVWPFGPSDEPFVRSPTRIDGPRTYPSPRTHYLHRISTRFSADGRGALILGPASAPTSLSLRLAAFPLMSGTAGNYPNEISCDCSRADYEIRVGRRPRALWSWLAPALPLPSPIPPDLTYILSPRFPSKSHPSITHPSITTGFSWPPRKSAKNEPYPTPVSLAPRPNYRIEPPPRRHYRCAEWLGPSRLPQTLVAPTCGWLPPAPRVVEGRVEIGCLGARCGRQSRETRWGTAIGDGPFIWAR